MRIQQSVATCLGACLALASLLGGCVGLPAPKYPQTDGGAALARQQAPLAALEGIRAEARVDQRAKDGRIRGTVLMFVTSDARVRFDVMTQFGPVAILTSDRERFAFSDLRESKFMTGATCPRNIARLLGVPLSVEDTAHFLLSGTPLIKYDKASVEWQSDGYYLVQLSAASGERQKLQLGVYDTDLNAPPAQQRLYLMQSELFDARGKSTLRVTYEDQAGVKLGGSNVIMPFRIHVEQAQTATDTLIHFKDIAFNPEIPEGAFMQEARPGMSSEEASCE